MQNEEFEGYWDEECEENQEDVFEGIYEKNDFLWEWNPEEHRHVLVENKVEPVLLPKEGSGAEDLPDVGHREDLENIANPELKQHHIEIAQDLAEQRAETVQLFETGQITRDQMEARINYEIRPKESRAATAAGLASQGITGDHLGETAENYDLIIDKAANPESPILDLKDQVKQRIRTIGPEPAQEMADRMYDESEIEEEAYRMISRLARLEKNGQ